jgi:anti-sigma factor RsiW
MNCEAVEKSLSPYVDDELLQSDRSQIDAHLAVCGSCREHATSARELKHAIARLESRDEIPVAVRARVSALRFGSRGLRAAAAPGQLLATVLGLCLVATASLIVRHQSSQEMPLGEELIADYLRSLPDVNPAEVASSDPSEVIRFFSGKTPFEPVVPTIPAAHLVGGRLCSVAGRRVELLFYTQGETRKTVALFVCDGAIGNNGCNEYLGRALCSRRLGKLTVVATGEVPRQILEQLLRETTL